VLSEFLPKFIPTSRRTVGMNPTLPAELDDVCCRHCRFWRKRHSVDDADDWGECRRMPPSLPEVGDEKLVVAGVWPCTKAADWCGEWEPLGLESPPPEPS